MKISDTATVREKAFIELGSEVGDFADIGEGSRVIYGVRIPPSFKVPANTYAMPHYDTRFLLQNLVFTPDERYFR